MSNFVFWSVHLSGVSIGLCIGFLTLIFFREKMRLKPEYIFMCLSLLISISIITGSAISDNISKFSSDQSDSLLVNNSGESAFESCIDDIYVSPLEDAQPEEYTEEEFYSTAYPCATVIILAYELKSDAQYGVRSGFVYLDKSGVILQHRIVPVGHRVVVGSLPARKHTTTLINGYPNVVTEQTGHNRYFNFDLGRREYRYNLLHNYTVFELVKVRIPLPGYGEKVYRNHIYHAENEESYDKYIEAAMVKCAQFVSA